MRTDGSHTRWSAFSFQTQLLPLTVPVTVSVTERFDVVRAARHEAARDALRRSVHAPSTCPSCGRGLTVQPVTVEGGPPMGTAPAAAGGVTRRRSEAEVAGAAMMRALVEALAGRRPLSQLAGLADVQVLRWARAEGHRLRHARQSVLLLSVRVQQTRAETAELSGSIRLGGRPHAYAGRLESRGTTWSVVELRILRSACPPRAPRARQVRAGTPERTEVR